MTSKQETGFHVSGENPLLAVIAINARVGIRAGETECYMDKFLLPPACRSQETVSPSLDHDFESFLCLSNKDLIVQG